MGSWRVAGQGHHGLSLHPLPRAGYRGSHRQSTANNVLLILFPSKQSHPGTAASRRPRVILPCCPEKVSMESIVMSMGALGPQPTPAAVKPGGSHVASWGWPARILAFGDSLTEGYYNYGCQFHPYATKLQRLLSETGPTESEVKQSGVSGECVLDGMQERLQSELAEATSAGDTFDWVILLAGINDVASDQSSAEVFQGLDNMYQECKNHGARVLAMTLLENRGSFHKSSIEQERKNVNALIRKYCQNNDNMVLCDLDVLLPYVSLTEVQRAEWFDDGLHLTSSGYDRMASIIFETLEGERGSQGVDASSHS